MADRQGALRRRLIRHSLAFSALGVLAQAHAAQAQVQGNTPQAEQTAPTQDKGIDPNAPAAQPTAAQAGAAEDQRSSSQLQDIIVTAQRRSESLQETPVAVTAFSAADLEEKQVRSARDLITLTPNLQIIRAPGFSANFVEFSIRGFAISRPLLGVQQPVGVYVDDFFYPSLNGSLLRVLDLQSVEVLRGPQGTLFGQNSVGGAIRYNTIAPDTTALGGHAEVTVGERNRHDFTAALNIPLGDMFAVRLSGGSLHQDGYVTDQTTGKPVGNTQGTVGRIQARFKPTSNFTADLTGEYVKSKQDGDPQVSAQIVNPGQPFSDPLAKIDGRAPDPLNPPFLSTPGVVSADGKSVIYAGTYVPSFDPTYNSSLQAKCGYCSSGTTAPEFADTVTKDVRATLAWSPSNAITIKSLTSYFDIRDSNYIDADHTYIDKSQQTGNSTEKAFSQELQAGGVLWNDRLTYVAGLYYYHYTEALNTVSFGGAPPPPPATSTTVTNSTVERNSYAAYAQVSLKITPSLTATVGGRETHERVGVTSATNGVLVVPDKATFNGFTPTFKLQYQLTPTIMAYASASKGFRGGTINTVDPAIFPQVPVQYGLKPVQPDTAWSYEGGVRTQFFDRHLQINATYFDAEFKNIQTLLAYPPVCQPGVPCLPIPQSVLANVGDARFNGVEVETQAALGRLMLHGNVSTLNARYTRIDAAAAIADLTVNSLFEHAPKWSYSVGASYRAPVTNGAVQANLDYGWQARQVAGNQDHVSQYLPSYGLLNGRVAIDVGKNYTFSVAMSNILNKYYIINSNNNLFYLGIDYYEPGEPRTFSAAVQVRF